MANVRVTFKVNACPCYKELYVCGNLAELGEWDSAKAIKLAYKEDKGCYSTTKSLPEGSLVEYKVLSSKDWANVECAEDGSELCNHSFTANKGSIFEVDCKNFR